MAITFIPAELRTFERDEAFWRRIDRGGADDCWLWSVETQLTQGGYGAGFYGPIHTSAHRIAYMLVKGPIPPGKQALHSCDSRWEHDPRRGRRCCNPWHVYAGKPQDNSDDRVRLGRHRHKAPYKDAISGDCNPNAKLTVAHLPLLLEDAKTMSQRKVAAKYGISKSQVGNILRGESRPSAIKTLSEAQRDAVLDANSRRAKR